MIWALLSAALAGDLPARPTLGEVDANACPESDVIDGRATLTEGCSGVVLPVPVWAHLEALAVDSRHVRELYRIEQAAAGYELALTSARAETCQVMLAAELAPVPFWHRPGVHAAGYMMGGAVAVVAGAWAIGLAGQ